MICAKYKKLTDFEQSLFLAKVIHCVTNSDELFSRGEKMIEFGLKVGLFDNVKFGNEEIAKEKQASYE